MDGDTKKDLQRKLAQFLVQMRMETKIKKRSSRQTGRVFGRIMVLHHQMVSPQNGDTRANCLPSNATAARVTVLSTHINYRASVSYKWLEC